MSTIEQQLIEVQNKKKQILFIKKIIQSIGSISRDNKLLSDVKKSIIEFLNLQIKSIEENKDLPNSKNSSKASFSDDEVRILKQMINKIQANMKSGPKKQKIVPQPLSPNNSSENITFSLENIDLKDKFIMFEDGEGTYAGTVCAFEKPFIVVKVEDVTGMTYSRIKRKQIIDRS